MERFGIRRVVAAALALVAVGSGLTLVMTGAWQLWLLWGFAVGIGTGSLALVFGAIVANRWFVRHRGVVVGVFSAASCHRSARLPAGHRPARRRPRLAVGCGPGQRLRAAAACRWSGWVLRDSPADAGTTAYGAEDEAAPTAAVAPTHGVAPPGWPSAR